MRYVSKKNINQKIKILINTTVLLSPLTGIGNYTYNIARCLKLINHHYDYTYFYGYYSKELFTYNDSITFHLVKELIRKISILGIAARGLKNIISKLSNKQIDLYFEPNFIPFDIEAKHVVATVHDFSFILYSEWHPRDRVIYFERNFWKAIEKADRIIVPSNYIRETAIEMFGFEREKLRTIYYGVDTAIFRSYQQQDLQFLRNKYSLPDKFILFVGSIEPRKNIKNLIHAYTQLDEDIRRNYKLVLVGFKGWENKEIMDMLNKLRTDVKYLGYVTDQELAKLYNLATLFVFPSIYEGFGLPPLEAMACGCPVIVSNVASLPEVCEDSAYYVDPYNVEGIAEGIYRILTDEGLRQDLIKKGFERARLFSWEKSAREHIKVFEEVLAGK